jgi:hypothetical protein
VLKKLNKLYLDRSRPYDTVKERERQRMKRARAKAAAKDLGV